VGSFIYAVSIMNIRYRGLPLAPTRSTTTKCMRYMSCVALCLLITPPVSQTRFCRWTHRRRWYTPTTYKLGLLPCNSPCCMSSCRIPHRHNLPEIDSVEPEADQPNHYTLSLSMKFGHVERALCDPVTLRLSIDPRRLDFSVL
jgi:hypothetical protein